MCGDLQERTKMLSNYQKQIIFGALGVCLQALRFSQGMIGSGRQMP